MPCSTVSITLVGLVVGCRAHAAIIHHDPQDIIAIPAAQGLIGSALIDTNLDGVPDFEASSWRSTPGVFAASNTTLIQNARPGPRFAGEENEVHIFPAGTTIGLPGWPFSSGPGYLWAWLGFTGLGQWSYGQGDALAGFSIDRAGQTHFGWMRVSIDAGGDPWLPQITVHEWAWENQPGVPIAAGAVPAPDALAVGLLALVALGRRGMP